MVGLDYRLVPPSSEEGPAISETSGSNHWVLDRVGPDLDEADTSIHVVNAGQSVIPGSR